MKKYKKLAFIFFILVIAIMVIFIYKSISQGEGKSQEQKALSEVEFLEEKLVKLANQINNIEIRNYNVSVTEINKKESTEKNLSSETSNQGNNQSSQNESGSSGGKEQGGNTGGNNTTVSMETQLKSSGILNKSDQINWDEIKAEIEILYSSIPTITLDLYQMQVDQNDILSFNKEMDVLTQAVEQKNKEQTLKSLSNLYNYIPKFADKVTNDELIKTEIDSKSKLIQAYSKLDSKNWSEIGNNVKQATEVFTKLLANTNINSNKQYTINKIYVMLNEIQNAVNVQDENVFFIKYKNILEEMNDL